MPDKAYWWVIRNVRLILGGAVLLFGVFALWVIHSLKAIE
jgi:hypothetical protein